MTVGYHRRVHGCRSRARSDCPGCDARCPIVVNLSSAARRRGSGGPGRTRRRSFAAGRRPGRAADPSPAGCGVARRAGSAHQRALGASWRAIADRLEADGVISPGRRDAHIRARGCTTAGPGARHSRSSVGLIGLQTIANQKGRDEATLPSDTRPGDRQGRS